MPHAHLQEHIDLIARHEQEFHKSRTAAERAGDTIAAFAGSLSFVALHIVLFATWTAVNTLHSTRAWHFDPYPYALLDTVVATEAILLASFILMRQTRAGRRADQREHLMLQLLLLTEKEVTKLLDVNAQIASRVGLNNISDDKDLAAMTQETPVDEVAEHIRDVLPVDC